MTTATLRNARDTYVVEDRPDQRLHNKPTLWINSLNANTRYAYIYFSRPFPLGVTILSATLKLYNTQFWNGSTRIRLRRINEKWSVSRTRWANRPGVWSTIVESEAKTDAPAGTEWVLNVQPEMQSVANGAKWYGFRIETTDTVNRGFYGTQARWRYRPVLEVEWADNPEPPEDLSPAGGRAVSVSHPTVSFSFTDVSGDTDLQAVQVQTAATDTALDANTPAWDSGTVGASEPELDLGFRQRTASVTTTSASTAITSTDAEFTADDVGATITGTGIPAGTTITAVASATNATLSAAATASGTVTATITRTNHFPGVAVDEVVWWRSRVQDGAGLWSDWSEPVQFTRKAKGVITINNPAASPNNFVEEPTPPILWGFSKTQRAFQLWLYDIAEARWLWNTAKITSTDQAFTVASRVLRETGKNYRIWVRVWDNENRETTPGDPVYVETYRDFTYNLDPTVDPVTALTVAVDSTYNQVTLEWDRSTAPDTFAVQRDGRIVEDNIEPEELFVSGIHYKYVDKGPKPRESHDWRVIAIANGKSSSNNPTVSATPKAITTVLSRLNGTDAVLLFNPDNDIEEYEASAVHEIYGDAPPVYIKQSLGGYVGSIAGRIATHGGVTAQTFLKRWKEMREDSGMRMLITTVDMAFEAIVYRMTDRPIAMADGTTEYEVAAEFYQIDEW